MKELDAGLIFPGVPLLYKARERKLFSWSVAGRGELSAIFLEMVAFLATLSTSSCSSRSIGFEIHMNVMLLLRGWSKGRSCKVHSLDERMDVVRVLENVKIVSLRGE